MNPYVCTYVVETWRLTPGGRILEESEEITGLSPEGEDLAEALDEYANAIWEAERPTKQSWNLFRELMVAGLLFCLLAAALAIRDLLGFGGSFELSMSVGLVGVVLVFGVSYFWQPRKSPLREDLRSVVESLLRSNPGLLSAIREHKPWGASRLEKYWGIRA